MTVNISPIINENEMEYFTQFNIYKTLHFPNKCIDLKMPIGNVNNIKILSAKLIDTFQGTSIEGQHLTGKKLIVFGNVNIKLLIPYWDKTLKVFLKDINLGFSTFIIIPKRICENQPINLRYLIEDSTVKVLNQHDVLVSTTILLQFVDQYILE